MHSVPRKTREAYGLWRISSRKIVTLSVAKAYNISASVDSIRALNEEQDLEACTYFSSPSDEDEPYRAMHLYKAEDYYFVLYLIRPRAEWPDPESLLSAPPEIGSVYSQDFEPLALFSP